MCTQLRDFLFVVNCVSQLRADGANERIHHRRLLQAARLFPCEKEKGNGDRDYSWPEESIQVAFSLHHRHHPSTTTDDEAKTNFGFSVDRENERRP